MLKSNYFTTMLYDLFKTVSKLFFIISFLICFLFSCKKSNLENVAIQIYKEKLSVPENKMICLNCKEKEIPKMISDSDIKVVRYLKSSECTQCAMTLAGSFECKYDKITFVYVVEVDKSRLNDISIEMEQYKLSGEVFMDTCNAFLTTNPQIPDNEMFHTLVINKEGKVLMVGNIFQNKKMEALFKKVIANERKKHK